MLKKNLVILLLLLSVFGQSLAQIGNDKWNITGELMLPVGMSNRMFKDYMKGLVYVHPKIQYKPLKHWYVAFGPKYMYYQTNEFRIPFEPGVSTDSVYNHKKVYSMTGGMHVIGGDIELGYTTWMTPRFGMDIGLRTGIANYRFITSGTKKYGPQQTTAVYLEPTFSLILAADEAVAYRWLVGYNFSGFAFNNNRIGSTSTNGYSEKQRSGTTQSLVVGFAITYYFKNKRSDVFLDEDNTKPGL